MKRIKIRINYNICGDGHKIDPRECAICMKSCPPAIFLLHQSLDLFSQDDPLDPQFWRITPLYPSLCIECKQCVEKCPEKAITINL